MSRRCPVDRNAGLAAAARPATSRITTLCAAAVVLAATFAPAARPAAAADPAPGATLAGHWRLVRQTYAEGKADLAQRAPDLRLDVSPPGLAPAAATVSVGPAGASDHAAVSSWPAAVVGDTARAPSRIDETRIDLAAGELVARYRVEPPSGEQGWTLDIEERYALDPAGNTLSGTMTVRMSRDGKPHGGYVLHRRFERSAR